MGRLAWALDLRLGGRTIYRASEDRIDLPDLDGIDAPYLDGLEIGDYDERLDFLALTASERRISLGVYCDPAVLDIPAQIARGADLAALNGVLRLIDVDTEEVCVRLDGRAYDVTFGGRGDPLEMTLAEDPFEDQARYPIREAKIDDDTWSDYAEAARDAYYPTVIGAPGARWLGLDRKPASPAYMVDVTNHTLLVADYHVMADKVRARDLTTGTSEWVTTSYTHDLRGHPVTTAALAGAGAIRTATGYGTENEFGLAWETSSGDPSYGLPASDGTPLRAIGEVLVWALRGTTIRVDWGRVEAIRPWLDRLGSIDTWIAMDEPASLWAWLGDVVLPMLPVSATVGPGGLYFVPWTPEPAVAGEFLVACGVDPDTGQWSPGPLTPASGVEFSPLDEVVNDVLIRYAYAGPTGRSWGRSRVSGEVDSGAPENLYARLSRQRYGRRQTTVDAPAVWVPGTAEALGERIIRARSRPWMRRSYLLDPSARRLRLGRAYPLTDPELHLTAEPAIVEGIRWSTTGPVGVTLRLAGDPARYRLSG